jgi:hypothetical protein
MRVALLVVLAACGRVGFDARAVGGDAASDVSIGSGDAGDAQVALVWSGLAAYADQTCAIRAGIAYCWGNIAENGAQQVAPTPFAYASAPNTTIVAPGDTYVCMAYGSSFTCFGAVPGAVGGFGSTPPIVALSAGRSFACMINDHTSCWGVNDSGQLGLGDTTPRANVTSLSLGAGYTELRAGDDHACASGSGVPPVCWGHNDDGTMGTGSISPPSQLTPQNVLTVSALPLIAGWHACALDSGSVYCWGRDNEGELGDGGSTSTPTPTQVVTGATLLATGGGPGDYDASCAIVSGHTQCWGDGSYGRLGQGTATPSNVPVDVVGLPAPSVELAIGYDHTCALLTTDEIYCWGRGDLGQLGDGLMMSSMSPVKVALP